MTETKKQNHQRQLKRERDRRYRQRHHAACLERVRDYHHRTPLKNLFHCMKQRCGLCDGAKPDQLSWYADRGITISHEWDTSAKFEAWAIKHGWRPGLQIDRIDNNGPYSPANCRFVTAKENCRNRRTTHWVTYKGRRMALAEMAERTGIDRRRITYWMGKGLTEKEVVRLYRKAG